MKKVLIIFGVIVVLSACGSVPTNAKNEVRFTKRDQLLTVTTDQDTGCKYIIYENYKSGGITPLMLPDGTQDCS